MAKRLKIDLDGIAQAMESPERYDNLWYLDTDSGRTIPIERTVWEDVEGENREAVKAYPDWMKQMAQDVKDVLADGNGRFVEIPEITSREACDCMKGFILALDGCPEKGQLLNAINGKEAFRRFRSTVSRWPRLEKQWYAYRDQVLREVAIDWLASLGIEPDSGE